MQRPGGMPHALVAVVGALGEPQAELGEGWAADLDRVRAAYDDLRIAATVPLPRPTHEALARLQHLAGAERCTLATTAVDGLLQKASAEEVLELRGSLFRLACAAAPAAHPRVPIAGRHPRRMRCVTCGSELRPDVVLPGEPLRHTELLAARVRKAELVLLLGVDPELAAEMTSLAKRAGAAVHSAGEKRGDLAGPIDQAVPALVGRWLGED